MKPTTLVIHPSDLSTDFLRPIYHGSGAIVITHGNKRVINNAIALYDNIVILGHGTPNGLLNMDMRSNSMYTIDSSTVNALQTKLVCCIWCNASDYFNRYKLRGFSTGMFISEVSEAEYCGLKGTTQEEIDYQNDLFAQICGKCLLAPNMKETLMKEYVPMTGLDTGVVAYNKSRFIQRM